MSTQTENQHLTIPEIGDTVHDSIAAFGENFRKLDALTSDRIYCGSYIGDGVNPRTVKLPFAPKLLLVLGHTSTREYFGIYTQAAGRYVGVEGLHLLSDNCPTLSGDTFCIPASGWCNELGRDVPYIAFQ